MSILGPLILLFLTSGDISGFQSHSTQADSHLEAVYMVYIQ